MSWRDGTVGLFKDHLGKPSSKRILAFSTYVLFIVSLFMPNVDDGKFQTMAMLVAALLGLTTFERKPEGQ